MKNCTMTSVIIILFTLFTHLASAQEKLDKMMAETTPEERASVQTSRMKELLTLSEDQVLKVEDINLKYAKKMQQVYLSTDRKMQRFRQMKGVSDQKDQELRGVLTPSQYEVYEKNKEEQKEKAKEKRKN